MLSHEGGQDLHDRPVVARRISGDPLEGVDPTQADIQICVSKLVDGTGKTLGDLPLLTKAQLLAIALEGDLQLFLTEAQFLTVTVQGG
jgi:hypothetical protein